MQIDFSGIFDKFPKIPLMEVVALWPAGGGGWMAAVNDGQPAIVDDGQLVAANSGRPRRVALGGDRDIWVFS